MRFRLLLTVTVAYFVIMGLGVLGVLGLSHIVMSGVGWVGLVAWVAHCWLTFRTAKRQSENLLYKGTPW